MKKSVLAIMVGALCIILSSCQETPEESSVVSKVDGISEAAVCEPLKKGEKRETNVPTHWKFEEKKSNDRVVIQADIKLGEQSIGNLPVIEMQNHELTQEELNGLIDYFTDGEEYATDGDKGCVSGSVRQDFQQGRKLLAISIFYIDCRDSKRNPRGDGACTG